jgi:hypothetical protein
MTVQGACLTRVKIEVSVSSSRCKLSMASYRISLVIETVMQDIVCVILLFLAAVADGNMLVIESAFNNTASSPR